MTDHDTRPEGYDVHALSGAYAVDALDDLERARFEEHLRGCPDCREEVDSLRVAAASLAVDPIEPPARLRADVLAGIEQIRPLPPLTTAERARLERSRVDVRGRRPWYAGTGPMLVAAVLVLVALVGTAWLRPWQDDAREPTLTAAERVLTDPDADHFRTRLEDGSRVEVVVSRAEGRAVVLAEEMTLAPAGKDYQLWLQTPGGDLEPAGLMPDDETATVLLDGDPTTATGLGITVEPDGGSDKPSLPPVAFIDLSA